MKKIYLYLIMTLMAIVMSAMENHAQPGFGQSVKINDNWNFHFGDVDQKFPLDLKGKAWEKVQLPHDWSIRQPLDSTFASASGYLPGGIGWYSRQVYIPQEDRGKKMFLYFEGVYNRSEVFVNGKSLGKRPNGYLSFSYDISANVKYGSENQISVRVDHSLDADSRWYTGSGIYRNVWLVRAAPIHLDQWGVYAYPEIQGNKGVLHVETSLKNESAAAATLSVLSELLDGQGQVVSKTFKQLNVNAAGMAKASYDITLHNPQLWNITKPNLYTLRTTIRRNNKVLDQSVIKTGFRKFFFDADQGFALNGQAMKIKGVCLHHDAGVLGAAFYPEVWRRRLSTLKELGVNAIRTSHNPQSPELYALCDELGVLVLNEAFDEWEYPKRKWLTGWNIGTPGFQGSFDFFNQWGEKDLADMVKRDRNHLSIFAWSIGNEVDYPNDPYSHPVLSGSKENGFTQPIFGGYKKDAPDANRLGEIAIKLAAVVRSYDKSRPVTAGLAGVAMSNETAYPGALDIAGYNYTESRYAQDHLRYPKRVIYGSENRHDFQAWKSVTDNKHIFGQFLWTGIDYLGESGKWPSRGFYSGLVDFAGFIKPRGYFRQSLWSAKPMAYLGSYPLERNNDNKNAMSVLESSEEPQKNAAPSMDAWPVWNYQPGELIRVVCYTNAQKARLELNGKVVGEEKPYDQKYGIISWDIPFSEGKLEVIGMDKNGHETVKQVLRSSKAQRLIRILQGDRMRVKADQGIAQIEIEIVDQDGTPVVQADQELTCVIAGNARLLGMESGNNSDMGDYTDKKQRVFHGKMITYVQTSGQKSSQVMVSFTSPGLSPAKIVLDLY